MKILLILLLLSTSALAAPPAPEDVALVIKRGSVLEVVQAVYGSILGENYAIDPALVDRPEVVTVRFEKRMDKAAISAYVESLLASLDILVEHRSGYVVVRPSRPETDQEMLFYRPQYRSVAYLSDIGAAVLGRPLGGGSLGPAAAPRAKNNASDSGDMGNHKASLGLDQRGKSMGMPGLSGSAEEKDVLVFVGNSAEVKRLSGLFKQLDIAQGEVVVRALVYEVGETESEGSALQLALSLLSGHVGVKINQGAKLQPNSVTISGPSIEAVYSAMSTDTRFKVVSQPYLKVKSGSSARFTAGSDVPVLGAVQMDRNGNPLQSVEYRSSGVILELTPHVRGAVVDLDIQQTLSSFIRTETGVNNSPTLLKREVSTSITAKDDELIILGGLRENRQSDETAGLPFLPAFLSNRGGSQTDSEILLVLHVQKI